MKLDFVAPSGKILPLVSNTLFDLINVDGMTRALSNVSSIVIGSVDGDSVSNIQVQPRGIVLDLRIKNSQNIEDAKREIFRVIKLKQRGRLIWEQNDKTLMIEGIVESIEMPRFTSGIIMQISMHCEQPFWEDIDFMVRRIDEAINLHYFTGTEGGMLFFENAGMALGEYDVSRTRHIHNAGDVSVGVEIEILAYKKITNPIIYDQNGRFFGVGFGDGAKKVIMNVGDIIKITTHKGNKTITMNGTSILGRIKPGSTWLQIQAGDNVFSIDGDEPDTDNVTFSLIYKQRFI